MSQSPPHAHMSVTMAQQAMVPSAPMSVATASIGSGQVPMKTAQMATTSAGSVSAAAGEVEEINTKELAQRISAELKRYSIPQAIFAQRVLCRSQGTLSDLLRNPKPWSKLKSGRETFRRMWKWLQEPEFQRMSALRLAASMVTDVPSEPPSRPTPVFPTRTQISLSSPPLPPNPGIQTTPLPTPVPESETPSHPRPSHLHQPQPRIHPQPLSPEIQPTPSHPQPEFRPPSSPEFSPRPPPTPSPDFSPGSSHQLPPPG
ncbi:Homeobox protein onecut [Penaeus vannamei]|uniref:Homeobox protein onecut n=1 Tax=Penaeus vannamei TaxID=6689 RepID=A0A423UAH2_PENVA|nr:Homeobox protein onecut [Penaeus vannamei]